MKFKIYEVLSNNDYKDYWENFKNFDALKKFVKSKKMRCELSFNESGDNYIIFEKWPGDAK